MVKEDKLLQVLWAGCTRLFYETSKKLECNVAECYLQNLQKEGGKNRFLLGFLDLWIDPVPGERATPGLLFRSL